MKKILLVISAAIAGFLCCGTATAQNSSFPVIRQNGKIAIVAHRGFWNSEQAGFSENSIASLKAAQDAGLWGSECDIHLTADGKVIVNHNPDVDGMKIAEHTFAELSACRLPNGETRPSFEEYVAQAKKCKNTMLIVEVKIQPTKEAEDKLVEKAVQILKDGGMFSPKRVLFISFSDNVCDNIAAKYPKFINQYLTSDKKTDKSPAQYAKRKINGIDYQYKLFKKHPGWVKDAKALGMSVNVWTVNEKEDIQEMIGLGVDAITTNEPLLVRELLSDKEFRK